MKVLIVTNTDANKINHIVDAFEANEQLIVRVVHQRLKQTTYEFSIFNKIFNKLKLPVDSEQFNSRILDECSSFEPDLVFIIKGNIVKPGTLKKIKTLLPNVSLVSWTLDDMYAWHNRSLYYSWGLKYYDHVFTTKSYNVSELKTLGAQNIHFIYQAYSSKYHIPCSKCDSSDYKFDVLFIGHAEKERVESLNFLANNGIHIEIFGGGWDKVDKSKIHTNLKIHAHDLVGKDYAEAISCSKISLCFLRKINRDLHTSRSVEIPACRGFMIGERTNEHLSLFKENEEAVYFKSNEELFEKVQYYLQHEDERKIIAEKGYKRCFFDKYSYEDMVERILHAVYF